MFGGLGGLGDLAGLMKKARDLQDNLKNLQDELKAQEYTGSVAGGAVQAVVSGVFELKKLTISPEALNPDDPSLTEDAVAAAVNQALTAARDGARSRMQELTGGLGINLPGLF